MNNMDNNIVLTQAGLSNSKENRDLIGTRDSLYGRVVGAKLFYKGRTFNIKHVNPESLEVDGGIDLFGNWGDEFPLHLIR